MAIVLLSITAEPMDFSSQSTTLPLLCYQVEQILIQFTWEMRSAKDEQQTSGSTMLDTRVSYKCRYDQRQKTLCVR